MTRLDCGGARRPRADSSSRRCDASPPRPLVTGSDTSTRVTRPYCHGAAQAAEGKRGCWATLSIAGSGSATPEPAAVRCSTWAVVLPGRRPSPGAAPRPGDAWARRCALCSLCHRPHKGLCGLCQLRDPARPGPAAVSAVQCCPLYGLFPRFRPRRHPAALRVGRDCAAAAQRRLISARALSRRL